LRVSFVRRFNRKLKDATKDLRETLESTHSLKELQATLRIGHGRAGYLALYPIIHEGSSCEAQTNKVLYASSMIV
jgi:hypothetical protein